MTVIGEAYIMIKGISDPGKGLDELSGKVAGVGGEAEKSSGRMRAAFGQVGHSLTAAFGPAFEPISEIMDKFEGISLSGGKMRENIGKSFLAVGGAATVAGTMITSVSDKDKIAMRQLSNAVTNAGGDWKEYREKTEEVVKHQEHFGHNAVDTQKALTGLVTKTHDVEGSYKNMQLVADIAAQKNISLSAAGGIVGKVMAGNTKTLKQFGISQDDINKKLDTGAIKTKNAAEAAALDAVARDKEKIAVLKTRDAHIQELISTTKNKDEQAKLRAELAKDRDARTKLSENMSQNKSKAADLKKELKELTTGTHAGDAATKLLADKMKGQAAAAADTFTGKMKEAKAKIEDFVGEVGQKVGPALQIAGPAMMGFGAVMESGIIGKLKDGVNAIKEFNVAQKLAGVATKIWTGIQAAFNFVMEANPIFLVVAAIVALIAIIVIAYVKFKPFHDLVNSIGRDMKNIFLVSLHAITVAFKAFISFFEGVWKWIYNTVKRYWPIILAVIVPFIGIPIIIMRNWNKIINFFRDLWNKVYTTIKNFIDRIVSGIRGLWDKGSTLIKNFIDSVVRTITGLPGKAATALAQLGTKVAAKFTSMGSTAMRSVNTFVSNVVSGMGSIISKSVSALGNFGSSIKNKITGALANAKSWVTSAFSSAGSWLYDVGSKIVSGLASGIRNAIGGALSGAVSAVGSFIKSHKGPEEYDRRMLTPSGQWIMEGLVKGIENRLPHLRSSLEGVNKTVTGGVKAHAGLNVPHSANAAGVGAGRVINLFPYANIDFGQQDPAQIVQSLQNAIMASRL